MGVIGNSCLVLTKSNPYCITANNPAQATLTKMDDKLPCLSRGSIVSTRDGVLYATSSGLVLATPAAARVFTRNMIDDVTWQVEFFPSLINAVINEDTYLAFVQPFTGFVLSLYQQQGVVNIKMPNVIECMYVDAYDGNTRVAERRSRADVRPRAGATIILGVERPGKFPGQAGQLGAAQVQYYYDIENAGDLLAWLHAFNEWRIQWKLDTLCLYPLGGRFKPPDPPPPDIEGIEFFRGTFRQPLGGPVLLDEDKIKPYLGSLIFQEYSHDKLVFQRTIDSRNMFRIISGFKSEVYAWRVAGTAIVTSISVAETGKELAIV